MLAGKQPSMLRFEASGSGQRIRASYSHHMRWIPAHQNNIWHVVQLEHMRNFDQRAVDDDTPGCIPKFSHMVASGLPSPNGVANKLTIFMIFSQVRAA